MAMDLISRTLETIRVRAPLLAQVRFGPDTGIDMLEGSGSPFYFVLGGTLRVVTAECEVDLGTGDLAIVSSWDRHSLICGTPPHVPSIVEVVEARGLPLWSMKEGLDAPLLVEVGEEPYAAHIVSGNFVVNPAENAFLANALPPVMHFSARDHALRASIEPAVQLVMSEMVEAAPGFSAVAARSLELLFIQALRRWLLHSNHAVGWARGMANPNIRRALEAMYADPARDWSLKDLAAQAHQSRSTFASSFLAALGETPFSHLRRYRMIRAASDLLQSDRSVAELANDYGYASSYSFVRAFRLEMNTTPSVYRKAARDR